MASFRTLMALATLGAAALAASPAQADPPWRRGWHGPPPPYWGPPPAVVYAPPPRRHYYAPPPVYYAPPPPPPVYYAPPSLGFSFHVPLR
ncbi:hypothetical protein [Siccirubricoccus sp. G192]|uniref:hypothetical protein n=1 Tax=Siccirubricoccus sp. G192 TaxID=2849651 RepID=UPI001C2C80E2|nr:hypothetical protein [Siccirubricoccus sp. G192]MBV1796957.1 hypothetical protein [Siccirubricoccus sp. G192]